MPKSKEFVSSSEESDSDVEQPKKKKKKLSAEKKEKKEKKPEAAASSSSKVTGDNGETMFQLAKMRFVSVSEFRGRKYVNIREYYDKDGEMKPGKKGIALNTEQWQKLKSCAKDIDEALGEL